MNIIKKIDYLTETLYQSKNVMFIPISAWEGHNLTELSEEYPWYKGPTLL